MRNDSRQGRADNPFAGILDTANPKQIPAACYWPAIVKTVAPLSVTVGELEFYADEIVLCRQLTEHIEDVEPVAWRTENETCETSHAHRIEGRKQLKIYSPIKVGDVLLCLPSADQQTLTAIDILPK